MKLAMTASVQGQSMSYKTLTVRVGDHQLQEEQVYVVEYWVTAEHVLKGEDRGVVCLCIMTDQAARIANSLNQPAQVAA